MRTSNVLDYTRPSPIGTHEIYGLPKASMAEMLVTKQNPNSCDRVKGPQNWRQCP